MHKNGKKKKDSWKLMKRYFMKKEKKNMKKWKIIYLQMHQKH